MLLPHTAAAPGPSHSGHEAPFWEGCSRHELLFQRCEQCAAALFQPTVVCRECSSRSLSWERSAGLGTIYSWSTVWRAPTPAYSVPFVVAIVELDEGYQMMANVVGCAPEELRVGMRVGVEFHSIGDGFTLPYFSPRNIQE